MLTGEAETHEKGLAVRGFNAILESMVLTCCPGDYRETGTVTTVVAARHGLRLVRLAASRDDETAAVLDLQLYLLCRRIHCSTPPHLTQRWDSFYEQGKGWVRQVVARSCPPATSAADVEDLVQEVWREVVLVLPNLVYNHARGSLSAWLAGLARRKVGRLASCLAPFGVGDSMVLDGLAATMHSSELGPEETCLMQETRHQLFAALARFSGEVSPENYDLFCWRFFLRWSLKEIAAALEMSPNEVRCRYRRAKRKWRSLTTDLDLPGCGGDLGDAGDLAKLRATPRSLLPRSAR